LFQHQQHIPIKWITQMGLEVGAVKPIGPNK